MLRRILAALLCVVGLALIGLGIATATVWKHAPTVTATAELTGSAPLVITGPGVLEVGGLPAKLTVAADPETPVFLAYGRTSEIEAWVGGAAYTSIDGLSDWEHLESSEHEGEPSVPNPDGSDLWLVQETGTGNVSIVIDNGGPYSILAATDGTAPAPHSISLTMPYDNSTPLFIPAVVLGGLILVAGVLLFVVRRRKTDAPVKAAVDGDQIEGADGADVAEKDAADAPVEDASDTGLPNILGAPSAAPKSHGLAPLGGGATDQPQAAASDAQPATGPSSEEPESERGLSRRERRLREAARSGASKSDSPAADTEPQTAALPSLAAALESQAQGGESEATLPDAAPSTARGVESGSTADGANAPVSGAEAVKDDAASGEKPKKRRWGRNRGQSEAVDSGASAPGQAPSSDPSAPSNLTADRSGSMPASDPAAPITTASSAQEHPREERNPATDAIAMGVPRSARRSEAWRRTWGLDGQTGELAAVEPKPDADAAEGTDPVTITKPEEKGL